MPEPTMFSASNQPSPLFSASSDRPQTFAHAGFQGWIGAARQDITPPVGIYARNWGAAAHDVAEGVHRPLTAAAITLQSDPNEPPLVLVSLDLGWWRSAKDEWYVRSYVLEALQLDPAQVMLAFTHTHAGPVLCREDAAQPGGEKIAPYLDLLRQCVVELVRQAQRSAVPALLEWSYGTCALACNRDLPDPDGSRLLCGFHPSAPADDTLLVGRATALDGRTLATLVNYACHPTTLAWENRLLSPDFVGAMRVLIEAETEGAVCLFLQGASGELAPREQYTADVAIADRHGRQLAYAVLSVLEGMLPPGTQLAAAGVAESGAPLALWQRVPVTYASRLQAQQRDVEFPLKAWPTLAELDAQIRECTDRVQAERLNRKRRIQEGIGDAASATIPFWSWQVGDAFLIGHPNEAYSALQTTLRQRFPRVPIVVMNVVNGHFGYLPPADLYNQYLYAVWQTPFERGSLELLIKECGHTLQVDLDRG